MSCPNQTRLRAALAPRPQPLVQTQLTGREFTADVLVEAPVRWSRSARAGALETKGGISTKGETFADDEVANVVSLVVKATGLVGPANVQGFVAEDGGVTVHEVNPRFSGGLPLTLHAGADVVTEYLAGRSSAAAPCARSADDRYSPRRPDARRLLAEVYAG